MTSDILPLVIKKQKLLGGGELFLILELGDDVRVIVKDNEQLIIDGEH